MTASAFGGGVDEIRWLRPRYSGDILHCEAEVVEKTPSTRRTGVEVVNTLISVFNQREQKVMTLKPIAMWRTRVGEQKG